MYRVKSGFSSFPGIPSSYAKLCSDIGNFFMLSRNSQPKALKENHCLEWPSMICSVGMSCFRQYHIRKLPSKRRLCAKHSLACCFLIMRMKLSMSQPYQHCMVAQFTRDHSHTRTAPSA